MPSSNPYYANFERDGEEVVRDNLAAHRYQNTHETLAREWLRKKDQERLDARAELDSSIASSARDAALKAAEEAGKQTFLAHDANRIAHRANTIAAIALIVAIVAAIGTITLGILALPHLQSAVPTAPASSSKP